VLAGSVGLHHAVADRTVVNDLDQVLVGPLPPDDSLVLAERLLLGTRGSVDAPLAATIAQECGHIPFYIHRLVSWIERDHPDAVAADVSSLVDAALDGDTWETDHYYRRLTTYFDSEQPVVVEVLDHLAAAGSSNRDDLHRVLVNAFPDDAPSKERLGDLLDLLVRDHYLRFHDGDFGFASTFLRRAWRRLRRRLGP
jgi:hypothetical protein